MQEKQEPRNNIRGSCLIFYLFILELLSMRDIKAERKSIYDDISPFAARGAVGSQANGAISLKMPP
jgi:hypothetical protein